MDRKKEWFEMKKEYDNLEIPKKGVENMKKRMEQAKMEEIQKNDTKSRKVLLYRRLGTCAAAILAAFILIPNLSPHVAMAMEKIPILGNIVRVITFDRYEFEDDRHYADVEIPQLETETVTTDDSGAFSTETQPSGSVAESELTDSVDSINQEITDYITPILNDFQNSVDEDTAKTLNIDYEVVTDTDTWFTLRLNILETKGGGYQYNKYYHIDKTTGRQVTLSDLFQEDADYITAISENIKTQMKEQMAADEGIVYFFEGDDMPGDGFEQIQSNQDFYFNEDGEIVIEFDEYEVSPGYMGIVSFTIPGSVTEMLFAEQGTQTADAPSGMRKFMNYDGNRYVFMGNATACNLSAGQLGNVLGTLEHDIQADSQTNAKLDFSATFALGGTVYEMADYHPEFRIAVEWEGNYYICQNVGHSDNTPMDIAEYFETARFPETINTIFIYDHMGKEMLAEIPDKEIASIIDTLAQAKPAELNGEDYQKISKEQKEGNSYQLFLNLNDGTVYQLYVIPSLEITMIGDNRYVLPENFADDFDSIFSALSQKPLPAQ